VNQLRLLPLVPRLRSRAGNDGLSRLARAAVPGDGLDYRRPRSGARCRSPPSSTWAAQLDPQDIHDAASIDGAGFFRTMFQITIPLVLPILLVAVLFGFVFAFTDMIVVWV